MTRHRRRTYGERVFRRRKTAPRTVLLPYLDALASATQAAFASATSLLGRMAQYLLLCRAINGGATFGKNRKTVRTCHSGGSALSFATAFTISSKSNGPLAFASTPTVTSYKNLGTRNRGDVPPSRCSVTSGDESHKNDAIYKLLARDPGWDPADVKRLWEERR